MPNDPDVFLLERLKADDSDALKLLFDQYFPMMMRRAYLLTQNKEVAEELTQDVFIYLWNVRAKIDIQTTIKAYLMQAIKNRCYTYFRREFRTDQVELHESIPDFNATQSDQDVRQKDLSEIISAAILKLPEKTRSVFVMSREEEMSYQQIAEHLEVSVKTVEYHMGNALKLMRSFLDSYGYLLLLALINF